MRACDQDSIFSTGRRFRPDYGLLLELHALTLVAHSYVLLQVGAWAGLEAGMSTGLQGITERVGLNNSGLLLEVRLIMELSGGGGDWFWGSHG